MASLYFVDGWTEAVRCALLSILDDYLDLFGDRISEFQAGNDSRLRRHTGKDIPAPYLDPVAICDESALFYCQMMSKPEGGSDPCELRFMAFGNPRPTLPLSQPLSGLKLYLPAQLLLETPDRAAELLSDWAARLPIVHGTAGLAALSDPGGELQAAWWWPWLEAYPGLDYDAMGSYWSELRENAGDFWKPRASNWLTFLGPLAVDVLGGPGKLTASLETEVELSKAGRVMMLRAGPLPVLGSAATGGVPAGWRSVARLIRPIRFETYKYSTICFPEVFDRGTRLARMLEWIRRFD